MAALQVQIIHTSLLRITTPEPLPAAVAASVTAVCKEVTNELRGKRFSPRNLWFIFESTFSTIEGTRRAMPLAA
jgi:hypothetical protein